MMSELKPCPICGSIPQCGIEFYESCSCGEIKLAATVECIKCGMRRCVILKASEPYVPFFDFNNAFSKVFSEWNRSASE